MKLAVGSKVRMLRSCFTLKRGEVYTVTHFLKDGTVIVTGDVALYGPSAINNLRQVRSWELAW